MFQIPSEHFFSSIMTINKLQQTKQQVSVIGGTGIRLWADILLAKM